MYKDEGYEIGARYLAKRKEKERNRIIKKRDFK